jgi:DNA invertase Pin-like site-specific DNA recombinase
MPNATDFQLHIFAALAQEERRQISERTKAALAEAKHPGKVRGLNGRYLAAKDRRAADDFGSQLRANWMRTYRGVLTVRLRGVRTTRDFSRRQGGNSIRKRQELYDPGPRCWRWGNRCCVFLVEWWVDHFTISAKTNDIWLLPADLLG